MLVKIAVTCEAGCDYLHIGTTEHPISVQLNSVMNLFSASRDTAHLGL